MTPIQELMHELVKQQLVVNSKKVLDLFNQAIENEKKVIIEAHGAKQKTKSNPNSIVTYGYWYTGEDYYNDKFVKPQRK